MNLLRALLFIFCFTGHFTFSQTVNWKIQDDYSIKFSGKRVDGFFKGLNGEILFDAANTATSKISAYIDPSTIHTGKKLKDKHARSEKGLNTNAFPLVRFESTAIVKTGNTYEAIGNLTIKAITKQITIPFSFEPTATGAVFKGNFSIQPKDYGVIKKGTPAQMLIELVVPVMKY